MVIYERFNDFYKAYSDKGYYITRDGQYYEEAIDINETFYEETNIPIPVIVIIDDDDDIEEE